MASVNKVILVGNLGADPETRYAPSGDAICNIRIATTDSWRDKTSGEKREATEWHRIVFFGKLAEIAGQYLKKGSQIYVEGSLRTRKWQDKDGRDQYTTEIRADQMQMLGSRQGGGDYQRSGGNTDGGYDQSSGGGDDFAPPPRQNSGGNRPAQQRPAPASAPAPSGLSDFDDDIPF